MDKLECHCIWLKSLKDREPIIQNLEKSLQKIIFRFYAFDGQSFTSSFLNYKHIVTNETINKGMIGCLLSHIEIMKTIKKDRYVIFEDDCECVTSLEEINRFINSVLDYDILCLSASEYVKYDLTENSNLVSIKRFHGSHALIITDKAIRYILETFEKYSKNKIFLPSDWLYSIAIQEHNLKCYGPINPKQFFKQTSGLVSSINGKIRH